MPQLSDTRIRNAKPKDKSYKLFDERGLYLIIDTTGRRHWRLRYYFRGKEKLISLGPYPYVSLKRAREKREEARTLIVEGIDPAAKRKAEKFAEQGVTFEAVADEWLTLQTKNLKPDTLSMLRARVRMYLNPYIGSQPIGQITAPELLAALRRTEARGKNETAHRSRAIAGRIFRYAIATGRAERDIAADLKDALAPVKSNGFAAITDPVRAGMRAIQGYVGHPVTALALRLAPLVFVRPGELRGAEWAEFDLVNAEWRIPGARMKMGEQHIVPLSKQALEIMNELKPLTGNSKYVFPSLLSRHRPMSENTINAALRRLGYSSEEHTGHGFRSMASTLLNEQGFAPDIIELQLAHTERNKVRAAYNRAQRLGERRKMMQAWADYLDELRDQGDEIRSAAAVGSEA
jgi:integrase